MPDDAGSPRHVVERLLAGIGLGPTETLADLYAPDAIVELPFAGPGGYRLHGRDEIRRHFARAAQGPLRLVPEQIVLHETTDPEVVVVEYDYRGHVTTTGREFIVSNVQIVTVRQGLIVRSRDFHDHVALSEAMRA